jgi:N-acetylglucosaminyl-diphospho-decaprenol L-rhamnosyltransferase
VPLSDTSRLADPVPRAGDGVSLSIIIVSFNTKSLLGACLDSLLAAANAIRPEIIVIDNASEDGSADLVAKHFPSIVLIRSDTNLGFARACNRAAAKARGRHLLLLNPDTQVKPGLFEALLDVAARRPEAGIYGGRTLTVEGELDPKSCWGLPSLWSTACFALGLSTVFRGSRVFDPESLGRWRRDTEREVGMVTGCLLLIDRELWRRLSGFDERFFMYGEDADLNLRARQIGARPMITPRATITHVVGASAAAPARLVLIMRGKATLARRHRGRLGSAVMIGLLLTGTALRAAGATVVRRSRVSGGQAPWRRAWRERATWRAGWAEP